MRFMALDLSLTATGVAMAQTDPIDFTTSTIKTPSSSRGAARLHRILVALGGIVKTMDPHLVLLEGYAYGRTNQAHQLGELGGVVRLWLYEKKIPYVVVPPAVLKGIATGRGGGKNAGKDNVMAEAIRRLGYQGADNNQADAAWLVTLALVRYFGSAVRLDGPVCVDLTREQLGWVDKVAWPALNGKA